MAHFSAAADNSAMPPDDTKRIVYTGDRAELDRLIRSSGENPSSLALKIGRSKDYLRDYLKGRKDSITAGDWKALADFVAMSSAGTVVAEAKPAPEPQFLLERNLKVFAAAEGGPGEMIVSHEPVDFVPRPWYVQHVKDAYAVIVVGDSMEPVFEPGDMAIVNPKAPLIREKDAIFIATTNGGDWRATIKRLVKSSEKEFVVRQFNPPKQIKLARSEWQAAYRVVGKYSG